MRLSSIIRIIVSTGVIAPHSRSLVNAGVNSHIINLVIYNLDIPCAVLRGAISHPSGAGDEDNGTR